MHSGRRRSKTIAAVLIWSLFSLLAGAGIKYSLLQDIESKTWDWRVRVASTRVRPDPRIKIIMIDQDSMDRFAAEDSIYWPWPRSLYIPVLTFLKEAQAQGIAFDMLFTEQQSRVSDDMAFVDAVERSLPVVSSLTLNSLTTSEPSEQAITALIGNQGKQRPFVEKYLFSSKIKEFPGASIPIPELLEKSTALGSVNQDFDPDRIFRRVSPGGRYRGVSILTLPFSLFHLLNPDADAKEYLEGVQDANGRFLLRFRGPAQTYPWYTIDSIIASGVRISRGEAPVVPLSEFKDAVVFLGPSAAALFDLRPGPFPGAFPGVELLATAFDNLLHRDFVKEASFLTAAGASAIALLLIIVTSMFFTRFQMVALAALFVLWVLVCFEVGNQGIWLPMVNPMIAMVLAAITSVAFQYQLEGKQYKFIKGAFQHYVTPEVIEKIVSDPTTLSLGGERRELTIFFSDIQGFTTLSESMEPAKLVQFLNRFLSEMTDIILKSGGTIDKYEGDAIIAFWNAPLSVEDHRSRGVQAALACQRRLRELREYFKKTYDVSVVMRVGLNTGMVTVGNFGSSTRFNYTIIGDAANLAARLEGSNKVFGTQTLVSDVTRIGIDVGVVWRRLGELRVVGKLASVVVWEPFEADLSEEQRGTLTEFQAALTHFEQGNLPMAREIFAKLAEKDPPSLSYLNRIDSLLQEQRDLKDFSPVWSLTSK
jgi:adenylate cyclase